MTTRVRALAAALLVVSMCFSSGGGVAVAQDNSALPQAPAPTIISKSGDIESVTVVADESQTDKYGPLEYCLAGYCDRDNYGYWQSSGRLRTLPYLASNTDPNPTYGVSVRYAGNKSYARGQIATTTVKTVPIPTPPTFTAEYLQPLRDIKVPAPWRVSDKQAELYVGQHVALEYDWTPPVGDQKYTLNDKGIEIGKRYRKKGQSTVETPEFVVSGYGSYFVIRTYAQNELKVEPKVLDDSRIKNWTWAPGKAFPTADVAGESKYFYLCVPAERGYFDVEPFDPPFNRDYRYTLATYGETRDCEAHRPDKPGKWSLITYLAITGIDTEVIGDPHEDRGESREKANEIVKIYKTDFTIPDPKDSVAAEASVPAETKPSESASQPSKDNNSGSGGGFFAFLGIALIPLIFVILKAVGIPLPF